MTDSSGTAAKTRRWVQREMDNVVLLLGAASAALLGLFGRLSSDQIGAAVAALLAVMAFSQLRLREQINTLAKAGQVDPLGRLLREYPHNLEQRRAKAKDVLLIGNGLRRTSKSYSRHMQAAISAGAKVRVLVPDPKYVKKQGSPRFAEEVTESIRTFRANVPAGMDDSLDIRVMTGFPPANFNVLDAFESVGSIVVGYHEFKPLGEAAPILDLRPSDGEWFGRLRDEAIRLWDAGTPHA